MIEHTCEHESHEHCHDHDKKLKRPCRCGGRRFVEPKMKRVNCFPQHCKPGGHGCHGCRCCCRCGSTCCDQHPCKCGEA